MARCRKSLGSCWSLSSSVSAAKMHFQRLSAIFTPFHICLPSLRRSCGAVAWISVQVRNAKATSCTPGRGLPFGKRRAEETCACVPGEDALYFERKKKNLSSKQGENRSASGSLLPERVSMPEAKPWVCFLVHFQLCFRRRSGVCTRLQGNCCGIMRCYRGLFPRDG